MDDKWFIFFEDDWLFFHRSWNGVCVYQLKIKPSLDTFQVTEALITRDDSQFNVGEDLSFNLDLISSLIDDRLLNR